MEALTEQERRASAVRDVGETHLAIEIENAVVAVVDVNKPRARAPVAAVAVHSKPINHARRRELRLRPHQEVRRTDQNLDDLSARGGRTVAVDEFALCQ